MTSSDMECKGEMKKKEGNSFTIILTTLLAIA